MAAAAASLRGNHAVVAPAARGARLPRCQPRPAARPRSPRGIRHRPVDGCGAEPRRVTAALPRKDPVSIPQSDLVRVPQRYPVPVPPRDPALDPQRCPVPFPQRHLAPFSGTDDGIAKAIPVHIMVHLNQDQRVPGTHAAPSRRRGNGFTLERRIGSD